MLLHIYGPKAWHDDVYVVGDRDALETLALAIRHGLRSEYRAVNFETGDGEGFHVVVKCLPEDDQRWAQLALPYTSETAAEHREDVLWPQDNELP